MNSKIQTLVMQVLAIEINELETMSIQGHMHEFEPGSPSYKEDFEKEPGLPHGDDTKIVFYLAEGENVDEVWDVWNPVNQCDEFEKVLASIIGAWDGNGSSHCGVRSESVRACGDLSPFLKEGLVDSEEFVENLDEKVEMIEDFEPENEYEELVKSALAFTLEHIQDNL